MFHLAYGKKRRRKNWRESIGCGGTSSSSSFFFLLGLFALIGFVMDSFPSFQSEAMATVTVRTAPIPHGRPIAPRCVSIKGDEGGTRDESRSCCSRWKIVRIPSLPESLARFSSPRWLINTRHRDPTRRLDKEEKKKSSLKTKSRRHSSSSFPMARHK